MRSTKTPNDLSERPESLDGAEREVMRAKLLDALPMLRALEARDAEEAAKTLIAALEAPGPVRRAALLPMLITFDERMAEVFERGIRETSGAEQDRMRDGVQAAREDQAWMQAALDEEPDEPD